MQIIMTDQNNETKEVYFGRYHKNSEDYDVNTSLTNVRQKLTEIKWGDVQSLEVIRLTQDLMTDLFCIIDQNESITELSLNVYCPYISDVPYQSRFWDPIDIDTINKIADFIRKNKTIKNLYLKCDLSLGAELILDAINQNSTLEDISMSACRIGDNRAKKVAHLIGTHQTIKYMNFAHNQFSDESLELIANESIKNLNLVQNSFFIR